MSARANPRLTATGKAEVVPARNAAIDQTIPPILHRVQDVRRIAALGHSKVYELIREGTLVALKAGNRTVITADSLQRYVKSLPPFVANAGLPSHRGKQTNKRVRS